MVSLAKGADVQGNISCARVAVEDGAKWTGNIHMLEDDATATVVPKESERQGPSQAKKTQPDDRANLN